MHCNMRIATFTGRAVSRTTYISNYKLLINLKGRVEIAIKNRIVCTYNYCLKRLLYFIHYINITKSQNFQQLPENQKQLQTMAEFLEGEEIDTAKVMENDLKQKEQELYNVLLFLYNKV